MDDDNAPETSEETEDLVAWDEPAGATGERAPKVLPEDEVSPNIQSVRAGLKEADREQRLAAEDVEDEKEI